MERCRVERFVALRLIGWRSFAWLLLTGSLLALRVIARFRAVLNLLNAAERLQPAILASLGILAGIHFGAPGEKCRRERIDLVRAMRSCLAA